MIRMVPSGRRPCTQDVLPPKPRTSAFAVAMEPRTPQNFTSKRNGSLIVNPLRRGIALVHCGHCKTRFTISCLRMRSSAGDTAVDRKVTLNAAQKIQGPALLWQVFQFLPHGL